MFIEKMIVTYLFNNYPAAFADIECSSPC